MSWAGPQRPSLSGLHCPRSPLCPLSTLARGRRPSERADVHLSASVTPASSTRRSRTPMRTGSATSAAIVSPRPRALHIRHVIGRSIVAEFNASEQGRGQLPRPRTNCSIHCTQAIPSRCHLVMAPTPPSTTLILASSPHHLTQQRCPDPPRECGGSTTSTPSFHPPAVPRSSTHRCCPSPHPTPLASPRPPPVTQ